MEGVEASKVYFFVRRLARCAAEGKVAPVAATPLFVELLVLFALLFTWAAFGAAGAALERATGFVRGNQNIFAIVYFLPPIYSKRIKPLKT